MSKTLSTPNKQIRKRFNGIIESTKASNMIVVCVDLLKDFICACCGRGSALGLTIDHPAFASSKATSSSVRNSSANIASRNCSESPTSPLRLRL